MEEKTITLADGSTRTLRFSTASSRIAKLKHGRTVEIQEMQEDPMGFPATLFWLALLPHHPETTEEDALLLLARHEEEQEVVGWLMEQFSAYMDQMEKRLAPVKAAAGNAASDVDYSRVQ